MSSRCTRSRSAKIAPKEEENQTKIRDVFKITRNRNKSAAKKVIEQTTSEVIPVVKPATSSTSRSKSLKKLKTEPAPASQTTKDEVKSESSKYTELAAALAPVEQVVPDSPPRRARKTPTPTTSPVAQEKTTRRALFSDGKVEEPKPTAPTVINDPVIEEFEQNEFPFNTNTKKAAPKIKTVAQLQAALAKKGAVRKIHEQNMLSKSKRVEEHSELLKSPTKIVPEGKVCVKKKQETLEKQGEKSPLPPPDYVLPTYKTPIKEPDSDEEREKTEAKRVFEYGKAARLLPTIKDSSNLPLPAKYQSLLESFQNCDRIMSIYASQGRRCVLTEIQKNVQKNTKRAFTLTHIAQVIHVYPTCYHVRLEEQWQPFGGTTAGKYEHVIAVNMKDDLTAYMLPDSPCKEADLGEMPLVAPGKCLSPMKSPRKKKCTPMKRAPELDPSLRLEGWRMTCRSHVMKHLLMEKVKKCYRKFMESIGAPAPDSPIRRFHPKFVVKMDTDCPELDQAPLPEPPKRDESLRNMRDYMNSVESTAQLPVAVDAAIRELSSPVKSAVSANGVPLSPKKFAQLQAAKPKGTMSLMERIRAKEAARRVADAARDPEAERKCGLLQRLAQSMLRSLLCLYTQRQCRSMELGHVIEKIIYSCGSTMSRADVLAHLEVLCEVAPGYCTIKEVVGRKYLQISDPNYQQLGVIVRTALEKLQPTVAMPGSKLPIKGR